MLFNYVHFLTVSNNIESSYIIIEPNATEKNSNTVAISNDLSPALKDHWNNTSTSTSSTKPKQFSLTDETILSSESTNTGYYREFPEVVAMLKSGELYVNCKIIDMKNLTYFLTY